MRHDIGHHLAILILALLAVGVTAQERPQPPPEAGPALRVLLAAYPELRQERVAWQLRRDDTRLVIEAREAAPPLAERAEVGDESSPKPAPLEPTPPRLRAVVTLDEDGLVALETDGPLAQPAAFAALQTAALGSAPTTAETAEALRSAGARFPPDETVERSRLVPEGLLHVLKATDATEPVFRYPAAGESAPLTWEVQLSASATRATYVLRFEPIDGRLLSVVRR